ncbi:MAG: hypothetical protein ACRD04_07645 [Terriglobales bacterium]
MTTLTKAIADLEDQKKRIDAALRVLRELNSNGALSASGGHNLTPEGRRRIAEAQKRRWARARTAKKSSS